MTACCMMSSQSCSTTSRNSQKRERQPEFFVAISSDVSALLSCVSSPSPKALQTRMSFLFRIATFNPTRMTLGAKSAGGQTLSAAHLLWNPSCPALFLLDLLSFQEIYPEAHRLGHESTCPAGSISRRD